MTGIGLSFVQDSHSISQTVFCGTSFSKPEPKGKHVSFFLGNVFEVTVDIPLRYPKTVKTMEQICIVNVHYRCTEYHCPEDEMGIWLKDTMIGVQ